MQNGNPDNFLSPDNLSKLRLPNTSAITSEKKPSADRSRRLKGQFLKGPVPITWLEAAAKASGKGKGPLAVALAIRFQSGRRKNAQSVPVSNKLVERFGVSRRSKYKALEILRKAGLIRVSQQSTKSPVVTIVESDDCGAPNPGSWDESD